MPQFRSVRPLRKIQLTVQLSAVGRLGAGTRVLAWPVGAGKRFVRSSELGEVRCAGRSLNRLAWCKGLLGRGHAVADLLS
eukprot:183752-Rhodomonas_salina.1